MPQPPPAYPDFDSMPIGGTWRSGRAGRALDDTDPWSGSTLATIPLADAGDVAEAYQAAAEAQRSWSSALPEVRAKVLRDAVTILDERHAEIAGWITRESGGTVAKVEIELGVVRAGFLEAASMPHHAEGRIIPSDIPGKENRVYREPVGVVCLISPWDFPLYLTNRTLAPALALGNAVVIKPSSNTPVTGGLLLARILEEAGLPPGVLNVVVGSSDDIGIFKSMGYFTPKKRDKRAMLEAVRTWDKAETARFKDEISHQLTGRRAYSGPGIS